MLLKSLVIIGALTGLILGCIGTSVPWLFPQAFSPDAEVIKEVCYQKTLFYFAGKENIISVFWSCKLNTVFYNEFFLHWSILM